MQHGDAVGDLARARHVVGNRQRRRAELPHAFDDQVVDDIGHDRVEAGRRLVEEDDVGPGRDGARQRHALLHAAGKLCRHQLADLGPEADLGQRLQRNGLRLPARLVSAGNEPERHVLPDRQAVEQRAALEQHPHARIDGLARRALEADRLRAVDEDAPPVRLDDAERAFDRNRLAGARPADDDHRLARADIQIDAAQHALRAEGFMQAPDADLRFA